MHDPGDARIAILQTDVVLLEIDCRTEGQVSCREENGRLR